MRCKEFSRSPVRLDSAVEVHPAGFAREQDAPGVPLSIDCTGNLRFEFGTDVAAAP